MHVHVQCADAEQLARLHTSEEAIFELVEQVIGPAGASLVVRITLARGRGWDAQCYYSWFTPAHIEEEERPSELPSYFRLIEARVGEHPYPLTTVDDYGWTWYFPSFLDHLAVVIAHELYHYTQPSFAQYRSNNEWEANLSAL